MPSVTIQGYTNQRFSVYRKAGGVYSEASLTPLFENIPCRFVEYGMMVVDKRMDGELVIGKAQIWTENYLDGVRKGDIVVVDTGTEYVIKIIERRRDIDGRFDHTKLILV